jgi:hypothetical protein
MKKISVIAILLFFSFANCKKDNKERNQANTITATIDDVDYTFNVNVGVRDFPLGGAPGMQVSGAQNNSNGTQISITVGRKNGVLPGTYHEGSSVAADTVGLYFLNAETRSAYLSNLSVSNPAVVVVTERNASLLKGTFSGDVYLLESGGISSTKKTITKGQFSVNF